MQDADSTFFWTPPLCLDISTASDIDFVLDNIRPTSDAEDAVLFNDVVSVFINEADNDNSIQVLSYLNKWSKNHDTFLNISNQPNVKPLEALSLNLSKVSTILVSAFTNKTLTNKDLEKLNSSLNILKEDHVDVELVIAESLQQLIKHCELNYLIK